MAYPVVELLLVLVEKICVIVVIAYLITRTKYFRESLDKRFTLKNRAILILIFGAVSIFGTYSGIEIFGAIASVRDLGPMIAADAKSGMFVTLFYAVLDMSARTLTYVSAGHNPPVIFKAKTGTLIRLNAKGIALGAIADIELEERMIILDGGDIVIFYTDGVTEAINKKEVQFGEERLITTIKANHELSANDMIRKIKGEVLAFCGDEPQFDDITLMALKVE